MDIEIIKKAFESRKNTPDDGQAQVMFDFAMSVCHNESDEMKILAGGFYDGFVAAYKLLKGSLNE